MDHYYALRKPLPDDFDYLCRVARCHSRHEKACLRSVLETYFVVINHQVTNARIEKELLKYQQTVDANRNASAMRWHANRISPPEVRSQKLEKPKNKNKGGSAFAPPSWIPLESWQGFEAMRKKSGKPLTDRAKTMIVGELQKLKESGEDAVACLAQSEMNGWAGVFPVKARANGGNGSSPHPIDPPCSKCGGSTSVGFMFTSDGRVCLPCRAKS